MNDSGYTLVEPEIIGEWLGAASNQGMVVALLYWLVKHIKATLSGEFPSRLIDVDVLKVDYLGAYPAIGVRGDGNPSPNIAGRIEEIVVEKITATPVLEFLQFALSGDRDWNLEARKLLHASDE